MTVTMQPDAPHPERPLASRSGDLVRMDASLTIGAAIRAVRRTDLDDVLFDKLCLALARQAADGDPASRMVADWFDRRGAVRKGSDADPEVRSGDGRPALPEPGAAS